MTPIENVFMLSINANLDYETLRKVCFTGHSRVPVYEEIELPVPNGQSVKAKKIVGVLLVKQVCLTLQLVLPRVYLIRGAPLSAFYLILGTRFLCAVFRYTKCHSSHRMSHFLVFSINSRKVVHTWPLSRVHR